MTETARTEEKPEHGHKGRSIIIKLVAAVAVVAALLVAGSLFDERWQRGFPGRRA